MRHVILFGAALTLAASALANDTTASSAAGGLVLQHTDAVDMVSEDLFVSAAQVRVRYLFRNRTPRDFDTVVAFPMPDRNLSDEYGGDVGYPSGFRTLVAGQPISAKLERKAVVAGKDHTALLMQLKIPVAPNSIEDATKAMDRLTPPQKKQLEALGLAGDEEYDNTGAGMKHHLIPLWTVKDSMWWRQRFPAGRDLVVEHRYVPGVGGSVESAIGFKQFRTTPDTRQMIKKYCVDSDFLSAVDRLSRKDQTDGPGMPDTWIDYILTTGGNWRSPIGSFRLVVDKGKPGNLVSFCESGVKKIDPTRYEVRHANWRPTRDLHVLIIQPSR